MKSSSTLLPKKRFANLKAFFLKERSITNLLGWEGLFHFIVKENIKYRHVMQMYFLMRRNKDIAKRLVTEIMADPTSALVVKNRTLLKIKLEELAQYPKGTLGQAFYKHMRDNKIELVGPITDDLKSDYQYIVSRIITTHDIYHTVLGAKTDFHGEALVAAFTGAQIPSYKLTLIHVGAGILRAAIVEPALSDYGNLGFVKGWLLAKSSKQLFNVDWDAMWNLPLEEVRKQLGINIEKIDEIINHIYRNPPSYILPKIPIRIKDLLYNNYCTYEKFTLTRQQDEETQRNIQLDSYRLNPPHKNLGIVILGRAMFTSGNYLTNPKKQTLGACLIQNGIQVLIPKVDKVNLDNNDLSFDDMLTTTSQCIQFAKKTWPGLPIFLIGHSLSGMCFLIQQGIKEPTESVDGVITLGSATWNRNYLKHESSLYQLKIKSTVLFIKLAVMGSSRAPAKLVGYGDYDEHKRLIQQEVYGNIKDGTFQSLDKRINYYEAMKNVSCPVLSIASTIDNYATVKQVELFHANLGRKPDVIINNHLSHMDLANSKEAWDMWEQIADWIKARV